MLIKYTTAELVEELIFRCETEDGPEMVNFGKGNLQSTIALPQGNSATLYYDADCVSELEGKG